MARLRLAYRPTCASPGCAGRRHPGLPFCHSHQVALPEDIVERLQWAKEEGDDEYQYAIQAAIAALEEVRA